MSATSNLQKARASYQPKLPKALRGPVKALEGAATQSVGNQAEIKNLFPKDKGEAIAAQDLSMIEKMSEHMQFIKDKVNEMVENRKAANHIENMRERAIAYHDTVAPLLDEIRYHVDKLELMVDDEMWPLPKYRELLFIR